MELLFFEQVNMFISVELLCHNSNYLSEKNLGQLN